MPFLTLNVKRLTTNAKKYLRFLSIVTCQLSIVFFLSGCTAIGTTKPAALQVTSTPEASVFMDGKHLGKTPYFSDQINPGEYLLKVTISEATYVDKITLNPGALTVVNRELTSNFLAQSGETLHLIPGKKGLFVSSMPHDADLTIDGKYIGKTPALTAQVADGDHKVLISHIGYIQREFAIKTSSKYQLIADVTLASEIAKGTNNVVVIPSPTPISKVEITQTPQGFLRVRQEPSLASAEIGRVKTGEQLEIVQETKDWIKIKFEDKQGWISTQFTKKI